MTRSWQELVLDCRRAAEQMAGQQWRIADDAVEAVRLRKAEDEETIKSVLELFSKDVGNLTASTLNQYRDVAAAFPPNKRRPEVCWTIHRELRSLENRHELVAQAAQEKWSVSKARAAAGLKAFANITPQTEEEKANKISEWITDRKVAIEAVATTVTDEAAADLIRRLAVKRPDALRMALSDGNVSTAVTAAYGEVSAENRATARDRMERAGFGNLERSGSYYDVLSDLTHILERAKSAYDSLGELDDLPEAKTQALLKPAKRAAIALSYVIERLEGGTASLDDEFELLLEGE